MRTYASAVLALCLGAVCVIGLTGCRGSIREIDRLSALEQPELKCPQLIAYLDSSALAPYNPARHAQTALVESGTGALPFLNASLHERRYGGRARRLMLEAYVDIVEREAVKMLIDTAMDPKETPGQRAFALDQLVKLDAQVAAPIAQNLYLDKKQPRKVRSAAKDAYRALKSRSPYDS